MAPLPPQQLLGTSAAQLQDLQVCLRHSGRSSPPAACSRAHSWQEAPPEAPAPHPRPKQAPVAAAEHPVSLLHPVIRKWRAREHTLVSKRDLKTLKYARCILHRVCTEQTARCEMPHNTTTVSAGFDYTREKPLPSVILQPVEPHGLLSRASCPSSWHTFICCC